VDRTDAGRSTARLRDGRAGCDGEHADCPTDDGAVPPAAPALVQGTVDVNAIATSGTVEWDPVRFVGPAEYDVQWSDDGTFHDVPIDASTTYWRVQARDADKTTCATETSTIGEIDRAAPTCTDHLKEGDETGVDCGGPTCDACGTPCPHGGYISSQADADALVDCSTLPILHVHGVSGLTSIDLPYLKSIGSYLVAISGNPCD